MASHAANPAYTQVCIGVELEVIITLPEEVERVKGSKPTWYEAGRYLLGRHRNWINALVRKGGLRPQKLITVDRLFWPIRPGKKDFVEEGADQIKWHKACMGATETDRQKNPMLINTDVRADWEDDAAHDTLDFYAWTLVSDPTVKPDNRGGYAFEFVSPVLRYGPAIPNNSHTIQAYYGLKAVEQLYNFFRECGFGVLINSTCSTHVHISPELRPVQNPNKIPGELNTYFKLESSWTLERLRDFASASVWYEVPMRSLMDPSRRGNEWAQEFHAYRLSEKRFEQYLNSPAVTDKSIIQEIQALKSVDDLKKYMTHDDRRCAWNYKYLDDDIEKINQTLEFRWTKGSLTYEEAAFAVDLATSFAISGTALSSKDLLSSQQNMDSLLNFLKTYARLESQLGAANQAAHQILEKTRLVPFVKSDFKGLSQTVAPTEPPTLMNQKMSHVEESAELDWFYGMDLEKL